MMVNAQEITKFLLLDLVRNHNNHINQANTLQEQLQIHTDKDGISKWLLSGAWNGAKSILRKKNLK
jgi:hypothetical protein